jgi:hypothetical protein
MGRIDDTFNPRVSQADSASQAFSYSAVVSTAPADVNDFVGVTTHNIDNSRHEHEARWTPRLGATGDVLLPEVGDVALVTFDDENEAWVTLFWKADNE